MKKYTLFIVTFLLTTVWIFGSSGVFAQTESIKNFHTDIIAKEDGILYVTENITYDFGVNEKHGIFRDIKNFFINDKDESFETLITVENVTNEFNEPYMYSLSQKDSSLSIKIGDPNVLVSGVKLYVISYKVRGAIEGFSDHDELFWNVTGNEWEVPILESSVTINLPQIVPTSSFKFSCYTGKYGSKSQNCTQSFTETEAVNYTATTSLSPGEGMTAVLSFESGHIQLTPKTPMGNTAARQTNPLFQALIVAGLIIWYVVLPLGVIAYYFKYGRDPKPLASAIPALFEPPQDDETDRKLTPAETGTIIDESADNQDITATIVDLAIRGYLTIKEEKPKNVVERAMGSKSFTLVKSSATAVKDKTPLQQHEKLLMAALFKDSQSVSTTELKTGFYADSQKIKDELYTSLVAAKFFPRNPKTIRNFWTIGGAIALFTVNVPLGIVALALARAMPRKTPKGANAAVSAKGLKKFLTSQERQLEFQEKNWYLFEKLLPYAVAFGVTETWAKRFEHLTVPSEVSWYEGVNVFNALYFANAISSLNTTVGSISTPTRSAGGFSSGFGGGGFSGGGFGGGGGGGSW